MPVEVDPTEVRFTQDSIALQLKPPYEETRIDYAVDMISSGNWSASDFPAIKVVQHENVLWSLDNRRLWVFRKARVRSITVHMKEPSDNPRFLALINDEKLLNQMNCKNFSPRVRGKWRTSSNGQRPASRTPPHAPEATSFPQANTETTDMSFAARILHGVRHYVAGLFAGPGVDNA